MPKAITHERKLRGCEDLLLEFLRGVEPLHPKLGAVLLQFPASFKPRYGGLTALRDFLLLLPRDFRFAVEFRDPHWHQSRVIELLQEHRIAWAWNDLSSLSHQAEAPFGFSPVTTDFLYVRLMGDQITKYGEAGQRLFRYTKLMWPRDGALESWALKIRQHEAELKWASIYASNHFEGFSPATCQRIGKILGAPAITLPELPTHSEPIPTAQLELGL